MDIQYFLNILWRRKWLILTAMLVPAVATFIFIDRQEAEYKTNTILAFSAGTVDYTGLDLRGDNPFIQQFQLESGFESLRTLMNSRSSVKMLTYLLLVHDLEPSANETAFRQPDAEQALHYTKKEISRLLDFMKGQLQALDITAENDTIDLMINDIAKAYGYDYKTLTEDHLSITRIGETATLMVEFKSEHPELCAFAVNEFSKKFKEYRQSITTSKDKSQVDFLKDLKDTFEKDLEDKTEQLDGYKKQNNIVDLEAESQSIVSQISELEMQLETERQKVPALKAAIVNYNKYLKDLGTTSAITVADQDLRNLETRPNIINLKKQIQLYQSKWIETGRTDKKLESLINLTRKQLDTELGKFVEEYTANKNEEDGDRELNTRERNLLDKRINTESDLLLAEESVRSMEKELNRLYRRKRSLVSTDAYLDNLEGERKIALEQYTEAISKYSEADESYRGTLDPLNIIEYGRVPEEPEPSNKALFSAFSGVVGAALCTMFIFLLAFFDTSLSTPEKFSKFTKLGLIGTLNKIKSKKLDVQKLFLSNGQDEKLSTFKESIRNLRYVIENSKDSTFLFTSTKEDEGKTFIILNLAHSLQLKNKKILLVDTNFKENALTSFSNGSGNEHIDSLIEEYKLEEVFHSGQLNKAFNINNIEVLKNKGASLSPSEIFAGIDFHTFLDKLTLQYDYVFLEGPSLNKFTDTKELIQYTDKVIAVFAAHSDLKSADKNSIDFLKSLGHKFLGAILNKMDLRDLN